MLLLQLYKVDGSENRELQKRYGFRTVPMFLMYYQGQLVSAGNELRTAEELLAAAAGGLAKGRQGLVLPEGFSFQGKDNTLLDGIMEGMSLLGQ